MSDKKIRIKKPEVEAKVENAKVVKAKKPDESLAPGDEIEFALTEHIKGNNGRETWVRFGVTSAVRISESTEEAETRVANYVNRNIQEAIESL